MFLNFRSLFGDVLIFPAFVFREPNECSKNWGNDEKLNFHNFGGKLEMPRLFCSLKRIKAHSAYGGFLETNTALKRALHDLLSRGVRGQLKRDQVRNDKTKDKS